MFNVIYLTEEVSSVVAAHLVSFREVGRAVSASEALSVKQGISNLPSLISLREDQLAGGATGSKHPVEVLPAVELSKL